MSNQSMVPVKTSFHQDKESKKLERQRKRRLEEIEEHIDSLETLLSRNEQLLCDPDVYQDHQKVVELNAQSELAKKEIEALMDEWAELAE
jgi:ATP-binding cassette subfamily F protein 3